MEGEKEQEKTILLLAAVFSPILNFKFDIIFVMEFAILIISILIGTMVYWYQCATNSNLLHCIFEKSRNDTSVEHLPIVNEINYFLRQLNRFFFCNILLCVINLLTSYLLMRTRARNDNAQIENRTKKELATKQLDKKNV